MRFSIIATHYEGSVTDAELQRFIDSLRAQTFKDFEVIILHDGPLSKILKVNYYDIKHLQVETENRENKWGHNLRSLGMEKARGEYILNTNTDNEYFPDALEILNKNIEEDKDLYVMPAIMMGMNHSHGRIWYDSPRDYSKAHVLKGVPIRRGCIDMMQLVASRKAWESIGYWHDLSEQSDGVLYEELAQKYFYKYIPDIIGRHY